jgi:hypothetical protein
MIENPTPEIITRANIKLINRLIFETIQEI